MTAFSTPHKGSVTYILISSSHPSSYNYFHNACCHAGPTHHPTSEANKYTHDLMHLDRCHSNEAATLPGAITEIRTTLIAKAWENALQCHPDSDFRHYIQSGITNGFRIGFNRRPQLRSSHRNMLSALNNPEIVEQYLGKECSLGHIAGPLPHNLLPNAQINPFGVPYTF